LPGLLGSTATAISGACSREIPPCSC